LHPFTNMEESEYDSFGAGHSSTSISAALGMAVASPEKKHIAIIGDGAMTAGMAYEALAHAGSLDSDILVILNDNNMSISKNVGGFSNYLARIWASKLYSSVREGGKTALRFIPSAKSFAKRAETHFKGMLAPGTLFEELGFNYIGPMGGHNLNEIIKLIQKDLKTLERAVYSENFKLNDESSDVTNNIDQNSEEVLTRHLLKLSEIEKQFQELTNKFEEINFKIDKLSSRLSKVQADNQLRFQQLEQGAAKSIGDDQQLSSLPANNEEKILPGSSQPQDLGSISYKDTETNLENQITQSIESTGAIVTETFQLEEKILPDASVDKQYEFATSLLKVGDYNTAERAFREFVITHPDHDLAGSAQYWYAETFRIRQLYTDAASAYLEGYQKYPKGEKASINLLKLGVSLVQIGEKDQGCLMITGVQKQYPKANQSVLQKAKYEEKKFECKKENS